MTVGMECNTMTCAYYSFITIGAIILVTLAIHMLFYIVFAHWYVREYHSGDLVRWREDSLERIR
jgi:hypothetical protein